MNDTPEIGIGVVVRVVDETSEYAGVVAFVIQERTSATEHRWGVVIAGHPTGVDLPLWFNHDQLAPVPGHWETSEGGMEWVFEKPPDEPRVSQETVDRAREIFRPLLETHIDIDTTKPPGPWRH